MVTSCTLRVSCLILAMLAVSGCFRSGPDKTQDLWPYFELARKRGLAAPQTRPMTETERAQLPQSALERLIASIQPAPRNPNAYLLAVGIEEYLYLPDVTHTDASLHAVASALGVSFGVPTRNRNVISGTRATTGYITSELDALLARMGPADTLYLYFAGHSLPDVGNGDVHLLARDAQVKAYDAASIRLSNLIDAMDASQVGRVWAFMDTSFSGRANQNSYLHGDVAGLGPEPNLDALPPKISLFQAAQAGQYANPYDERGHRLFSYYLAEGIALGIADANRLNEHVGDAVTRISRSMGPGFVQTPSLSGTPGSLVR